MLAAGSSALDPIPTYLGADHRALARGRFTLVRIPIDPIGHVFRAGDPPARGPLRPGRGPAEWAFQTPDTHDRVHDTVALGRSSLVVDVVPGVEAPAALPACGALRGEPCRAYAALGNQG